MGAIGGVTKMSQINYEQDKRPPDAKYLEAVAAAGADVLYILTGQRASMLIAAEPAALYGPIKPDEAALLDNYRHCPPDAQATLRATGALFAQQKAEDVKPKKGRE